MSEEIIDYEKHCAETDCKECVKLRWCYPEGYPVMKEAKK